MLRLLLLIGLLSIAPADRVPAQSKAASPRIRTLETEFAKDKATALDRFWREAKRNFPLVEALPNDDSHLLVTYLWRGDAATERVEARGGPYAASREPFARLADSDVWYRSERLPKDARFVYGLIVKRRVERREADGTTRRMLVEEYPNDPLNSNQFNGGPVLELPAAPKDSWHVAKESAPQGRVEKFTIESKALAEKRGVSVYTPNRFDSSKPHALAVFFDGEECETRMNLPTVLDNLIAEEKIPPTVALLVHAEGKRGRDLAFHDPFVTFVADELVPWAVKKLELNVAPTSTLVGGMSLGGLTAAYAAHERPEVFGNVLSQSGSFWRPRPNKSADAKSTVKKGEGWFPPHVAECKPTAVRYYLEVGRFEAPTMLDNNHRLRDILKAQGNKVIYDEYNGGHDHVNWRVSVGRGLIALLAAPAS
jgi:enterochelin esterase family protein